MLFYLAVVYRILHGYMEVRNSRLKSSIIVRILYIDRIYCMNNWVQKVRMEIHDQGEVITGYHSNNTVIKVIKKSETSFQFLTFVGIIYVYNSKRPREYPLQYSSRDGTGCNCS